MTGSRMEWVLVGVMLLTSVGLGDVSAAPGSDFVRRDGAHLTLSGAPYRIAGVNYYPRDHAWAIFSEWDPKQVDYELSIAEQMGVNTLRTFVPISAFGGAAAQWGQQSTFHDFLALCAAHHIRVIASLFDGYRKWPQQGWDNWPTPGSAAIQQDETYLHAIVRPYAADPTILGWDVYNEPDWINNDEWQWNTHAEQRIRWLEQMIADVRADAPNHLALVGTIFPTSASIRAGAAPPLTDVVDLVSIHYYAHAFPGSSFADQNTQMRAATDKPLLAEEIGMTSYGNAEAKQTDFLQTALNDVKASDAAGALVWTLMDFSKDGPEANFGLIRRNYTTKPAASVFASFAKG